MLQRLLSSKGLAWLADNALAAFVVTIVITMIVPIAPWAADFLVALNIALAATVLFTCLLAPSRAGLSGLPYILLLATLFRLALNVSTTRLILSKGNAGEIINSFGNYATGGDFIVGSIVFLILVLVQFIVVAKGAERAAQIDARFTLDAMPGEQMSMDGDLSRGVASEEETRKRKRDAERDRKSSGSMEGAMNFIKGDAIAGIVISAINIVGGVLIGILRDGESAGIALDHYGKLAIGDGLVSQIPALLLSVAAGLLVTKVCARDEEQTRRVGLELFGQILARPSAVLISSAVMFLLAASSPITKLPWLPFVFYGFLTGGAGLLRLLQQHADKSVSVSDSGDPTAVNSTDESQETLRNYEPQAFVLELHADLPKVIGLDRDEVRAKWLEALQTLRHKVSRDLGFDVPLLRLERTRTGLAPGTYAFHAYDGLLAIGRLGTDMNLVAEAPRRVLDKGIECEPTPMPGSRCQVALVPDSALERCLEAGCRVLSPLEVVLTHAEALIKRYAADLITFQEVTRLVDGLRQRHPSLVQSVIPGIFPVADIAEILRALLREQVPVRDLRSILEALASLSVPPDRRTPRLVLESVRLHMRKALCSHFAVKRKRLDYYMFDVDFEDMIRDHALGRSLSPEDCEEIRVAVKRTIDPAAHFGNYAVIRVPGELRLAVHALLGQHFPEIAVFSDQEITPEIYCDFKGLIRCAAEPEKKSA